MKALLYKSDFPLPQTTVREKFNFCKVKDFHLIVVTWKLDTPAALVAAGRVYQPVKVKCCPLGLLLCVNTKASSSTEMVFKGTSTDPYKPVVHKWILKDYHQLQNVYARVCATHTQCLALCLERTSLWEIVPCPLRLSSEQSNKDEEWNTHLSAQNLPNLFAEGKWLREAFPLWRENLRQVGGNWMLLSQVIAKPHCRVRLIGWEEMCPH